MSEKPETQEFDDDDDGAVVPVDDEVDGDDQNLDRLIDDLDSRKKSGPKPSEPAWRRLERRREEQETAALLSDIDDYDLDDVGSGSSARRRRR